MKASTRIMSSPDEFIIQSWEASYYDKTGHWIYGTLSLCSEYVFFKGRNPEEKTEECTVNIPYNEIENIKKMRSTWIFSSIVIFVKGPEEKHWISSLADRNTVYTFINHFWKYGLYQKASLAPPSEGVTEKTELGTELLNLVHDSEQTLTKASEQIQLQGEQLDNCMATMYDLHEDLKVSENIVTGLESWMGQWSAIKKAEHDMDTVVITNKDIPNVYEYEVLYWKVDITQTPLHPCKDGILQISQENVVLMTPLQAVVESYKWEDVSRVRIVNPWEIQLSQYRIGEPDINYVMISVHGYKLVKKVVPHLSERVEYISPKPFGNTCTQLKTPVQLRASSSTASPYARRSFPAAEVKQQKVSKQLVSDTEIAEVSKVLSKLKSIATDIHDEEVKQNEKLDILTDSVESADKKIKSQTKRINKLL